MKHSAFDDFSEGTMEAMYEAWDFKTCKRSDGTTYGTAGECAQKGAKEVKKSDPSSASVRKGKSSPGRGKSSFRGTPSEQAVQRGMDQIVAADEKFQADLKKLKAGQITAKQFGQTIASTYQQANRGAITAVTEANKQVHSGEANYHYSTRIRKEAIAELDKWTSPIDYGLKTGALSSRPRMQPVPSPATGTKSSSSSSSSGGDASMQDIMGVLRDSGLSSTLSGLTSAQTTGGSSTNPHDGPAASSGYGTRNINDPRGAIKEWNQDKNGRRKCQDNTGTWYTTGSCYTGR